MAIRILENFDGSRYAVESYHDGVFRVKAHELGNGGCGGCSHFFGRYGFGDSLVE